ncbi:N-acetylneuraminate synthase family protein [Candidatus Puniceispirillum sp.]|nr:N-acetylneuraminate synthase family protein [Candidatus Puniceispirillum sp.]
MTVIRQKVKSLRHKKSEYLEDMNMKSPSSTIYINDRRISLLDPVYFIAEIGSNFDQDLSRAKDLIFLAKEAGADAVKFQHYTAGTLVSDTGFKSIGNLPSHQEQWKKSVAETYDDASLDKDWTADLKHTCDEAGITFFSSPYSFDLVDYIDPFVAAYKVGSGDITWTEIIRKMAQKGKPVLIATGASDMLEVSRAVNSALETNTDVVLMQCNTNYTGDSENFKHIHLNVLKSYEKAYPGILLGLSDHTPGHATTLGAVTLGARVIEKHFTDSTERDGPDHAFAMTPFSWTEMVNRTRELEAALGCSIKRVVANEEQTVVAQRRCVRASRELGIGTCLSLKDMEVLRPSPSEAIPPHELHSLVGKVLTRHIAFGEHLTKNHFE